MLSAISLHKSHHVLRVERRVHQDLRMLRCVTQPKSVVGMLPVCNRKHRCNGNVFKSYACSYTEQCSVLLGEIACCDFLSLSMQVSTELRTPTSVQVCFTFLRAVDNAMVQGNFGVIACWAFFSYTVLLSNLQVAVLIFVPFYSDSPGDPSSLFIHRVKFLTLQRRCQRH